MIKISKYIIREKIVRDILFGKLREEKMAVIMEEIELSYGNKTYLPSALNKILYAKYYNKSINSAKNVGYTICEFLNYVNDEVKRSEDEKFIPLKEKGLYGLNFYHLTSFINYCIIVKRNNYDTIKQKENRLFEFYDYIIHSKLLDNKVKFEYRMLAGSTGKKTKVKMSPFDSVEYQVMYPSRNVNKITKLKNMDEYLFQLFVELSEKHTPDITLGIVLQSMGGLRKGELVNLRIQDLQLNKSRNRMDAVLKKRQAELFHDRKIDISNSDVKKPRNQVVFNIDGSLYQYYERHLVYRAHILNKKKTITTALMVDKKGQSMSGSTYEQRFKKLKGIFLEELKANSYSTYMNLRETKWSTHICRGIFTNICIQRGYAKNIRDLANLRGDWSEESSKTYWDTSMLGKSIAKKVNKLNLFEEEDC